MLKQLFLGTGLAAFLVLAACSATPAPDASGPQSTARACTAGEAEVLFSTPGGAESVAVAKDGTVYTSDTCSGQVFRIQPDGASSVLATIPLGGDKLSCDIYGMQPPQVGSKGIAIAEDGTLWLAVFSIDPQSNGVWRVRPDGSAQLAFPMPPEAAPIPNDLVLDPQGVLYITESGEGAIWKASPSGAASIWFQNELLTPLPARILGTSGIAIQDQALYVANVERGTVIRVPIEADGTPGDPAVIASHLSGPDALEFDASGQLYAVISNALQLVRIPSGGKPEVVVPLGPFGMDWPTGLAFGGPGDVNTVYISNVEPGPPNVLKLNLCTAE